MKKFTRTLPPQHQPTAHLDRGALFVLAHPERPAEIPDYLPHLQNATPGLWSEMYHALTTPIIKPDLR